MTPYQELLLNIFKEILIPAILWFCSLVMTIISIKNSFWVIFLVSLIVLITTTLYWARIWKKTREKVN